MLGLPRRRPSRVSLQHVLVAGAHHCADRRSGEDVLGHRLFLRQDALRRDEHALDVDSRNDGDGAAVGNDVVTRCDRDIADL